MTLRSNSFISFQRTAELCRKKIKDVARNVGIAELTVGSECDAKGHVCGMVGFGKVSIGAGV